MKYHLHAWVFLSASFVFHFRIIEENTCLNYDCPNNGVCELRRPDKEINITVPTCVCPKCPQTLKPVSVSLQEENSHWNLNLAIWLMAKSPKSYLI